MNPNTEKLRKKYMDNPPEGMTSEDIRHMSEDDLLDMETTCVMMRLVWKVFISSSPCRLIVIPRQEFI